MPSDPAAIEHLLSWDGPLGRTVQRRIEAFEDLARTNAPHRVDNFGTHISTTIGHALAVEGPLLIARVGNNPDARIRGYAWMVHQGTRPHTIAPRSPRQSLRFRVGGRIVYATRVSHPGTRPDPYLARWIREITK